MHLWNVGNHVPEDMVSNRKVTMGTNLSSSRYLGSGNQHFSTTADFTDSKQNCDQETRKQGLPKLYKRIFKKYDGGGGGGGGGGWIGWGGEKKKGGGGV